MPGTWQEVVHRESPPSRGRGLKPELPPRPDTGDSSPPSRGRGLKRIRVLRETLRQTGSVSLYRNSSSWKPGRMIPRQRSRGSQVRLKVLEAVSLLDATSEAENLGQALVDLAAVPRQAAEDAAHIAIALANGVDFLVTWNFRHIANAAMRSRIEHICRQAGYELPVICTLNELKEAHHDE